MGKIFQAKGRVDPRKQMIYTVVLAMMPFVGFILFVLVDVFEIVSQRGLWLTEERIAVFALSPFLVLIPFIRIGKTIKDALHVIPSWLVSITFVLTSDVGTLTYDVISMIAAIASMVLIFVATSAGHFITKWSKEWNEKMR